MIAILVWFSVKTLPFDHCCARLCAFMDVLLSSLNGERLFQRRLLLVGFKALLIVICVD